MQRSFQDLLCVLRVENSIFRHQVEDIETLTVLRFIAIRCQKKSGCFGIQGTPDNMDEMELCLPLCPFILPSAKILLNLLYEGRMTLIKVVKLLGCNIRMAFYTQEDKRLRKR